jgi:hypothetical protein
MEEEDAFMTTKGGPLLAIAFCVTDVVFFFLLPKNPILFVV